MPSLYLFLFALLPFFFLPTVQTVAGSDSDNARAARELMLTELEAQTGWPQVYSGEWLLDAGSLKDRELVYGVFLKIEQSGPHTGTDQIGIWRVLAKSAPNSSDREKWIEAISRIATTPDEPRRLHAVETLCRLKTSSLEVMRSAMEWKKTAEPPIVPFCTWIMALPSSPLRQEAMAELRELLKSENATVRARSAYALGELGRSYATDYPPGIGVDPRPDNAAALRQALATEKPQTNAFFFLQCALYQNSTDEAERTTLRHALLSALPQHSASARLIASALAESIPAEEQSAVTERLRPLLKSDDFHLRWAAARLM